MKKKPFFSNKHKKNQNFFEFVRQNVMLGLGPVYYNFCISDHDGCQIK